MIKRRKKKKILDKIGAICSFCNFAVIPSILECSHYLRETKDFLVFEGNCEETSLKDIFEIVDEEFLLRTNYDNLYTTFKFIKNLRVDKIKFKGGIKKLQELITEDEILF